MSHNEEVKMQQQSQQSRSSSMVSTSFMTATMQTEGIDLCQNNNNTLRIKQPKNRFSFCNITPGQSDWHDPVLFRFSTPRRREDQVFTKASAEHRFNRRNPTMDSLMQTTLTSTSARQTATCSPLITSMLSRLTSEVTQHSQQYPQANISLMSNSSNTLTRTTAAATLSSNKQLESQAQTTFTHQFQQKIADLINRSSKPSSMSQILERRSPQTPLRVQAASKLITSLKQTQILPSVTECSCMNDQNIFIKRNLSNSQQRKIVETSQQQPLSPPRKVPVVDYMKVIFNENIGSMSERKFSKYLSQLPRTPAIDINSSSALNHTKLQAKKQPQEESIVNVKRKDYTQLKPSSTRLEAATGVIGSPNLPQANNFSLNNIPSVTHLPEHSLFQKAQINLSVENFGSQRRLAVAGTADISSEVSITPFEIASPAANRTIESRSFKRMESLQLNNDPRIQRSRIGRESDNRTLRKISFGEEEDLVCEPSSSLMVATSTFYVNGNGGKDLKKKRISIEGRSGDEQSSVISLIIAKKNSQAPQHKRYGYYHHGFSGSQRQIIVVQESRETRLVKTAVQRLTGCVSQATKLPKIYNTKSYNLLHDLWARHTELRDIYLDKETQSIKVLDGLGVAEEEVLKKFTQERLRKLYEQEIAEKSSEEVSSGSSNGSEVVEEKKNITFEDIVKKFFVKDLNIIMTIIEEYVMKAQQSQLSDVAQQIITQSKTVAEIEGKIEYELALKSHQLTPQIAKFKQEYRDVLKPAIERGHFFKEKDTALLGSHSDRLALAEKKLGTFDLIGLNQKCMGGFISRLQDNIRKSKLRPTSNRTSPLHRTSTHQQ